MGQKNISTKQKYKSKTGLTRSEVGKIVLAKYHFQKGVLQSKLPGRHAKGGRHKGKKLWRTVIEHYAQLQAPEKLIADVRKYFLHQNERITVQEAIVMRCYINALCGDMGATTFLVERSEGKVEAASKTTGDEDERERIVTGLRAAADALARVDTTTD